MLLCSSEGTCRCIIVFTTSHRHSIPAVLASHFCADALDRALPMDAQEAITDVGEVMGAGEEPGGSPDHQHANGASSSGLPAASEEASEEEPIRKRCVQAAPSPIVAPPLFLSAAGCLHASPDQHATIVPLHAPCTSLPTYQPAVSPPPALLSLAGFGFCECRARRSPARSRAWSRSWRPSGHSTTSSQSL